MINSSSFLAAVRRPGLGILLAVASIVAVAGCGSPNPANIELRKKNQDLEDQVHKLNAQHERDAQTIAALESSRPAVPTLPPDRLAMLFTTHGLTITDSTAGDNADATAGFDTQLKVGIDVTDQEGTSIKSAGLFTIEAFDLDDPQHPLLGTWKFDGNRSRENFFSRFGLYGYVLACPWQTKPVHPNLTVKVGFVDGLTGLTFTAQKQVKVRPPK